jgi:purine-binding chemotaxis protein CheW
MSEALTVIHDNNFSQLLSVYISDQKFGIPIMQIQDVLREQAVTKIPLSSPVVEGVLNLRGRVVTAVNVRKRLGLPITDNKHCMSVVVEQDGELFSLIIDKVGDVLRTKAEDMERNPAKLDAIWREVSLGVFQLDGELMVVLDVPKLLQFNA